MLTILIRHTIGRRELLRRCIASILEQEGNYDIVISYDYDMSSEDMIYVVEFFGEELPFVRWRRVFKTPKPYAYNTYCNILMRYVPPSSWYMFVDDDDVVICGALPKLEKTLKSIDRQTPVIVQFKRGEKLKPSNDFMEKGIIQSGKIGMPCIVLNKDLEHNVEFTDAGNADYIFIKQVTEKHKPFFLKMPVVYCDRRSHGLPIKNTGNNIV